MPPIWAVPRGLAYRWNENPQQFGFEFRDLEVNKKMLKTLDLWLERLHTIDMIYSTNIILPGSIAENCFGLAILCVTTYFWCNWGAREALRPLVGAGCTALVRSIKEALKTRVLGFLRLQNEYFWTAATIYDNLQQNYFLTRTDVHNYLIWAPKLSVAKIDKQCSNHFRRLFDFFFTNFYDRLQISCKNYAI